MKRILLFLFPPSIDATNDPDIRNEVEWYSSEFKPVDGSDYAPALSYAQDKYKESREIFASLDKKAEWFYGLGLAAVAAVYVMAPVKTFTSLAYGLPSFMLAAYALFLVTRAKTPRMRPASMDIRGAIECVDATSKPIPWICASLHCATEAMAKTNGCKASQIRNASMAIILAFFLAPTILFSSLPSQEASTLPTLSRSVPAETAEPASCILSTPVVQAVQEECVSQAHRSWRRLELGPYFLSWSFITFGAALACRRILAT